MPKLPVCHFINQKASIPSEMVEVVGLTMIFSFLVATILILLFTSDQANTKNLYLKKAK